LNQPRTAFLEQPGERVTVAMVAGARNGRQREQFPLIQPPGLTILFQRTPIKFNLVPTRVVLQDQSFSVRRSLADGYLQHAAFSVDHFVGRTVECRSSTMELILAQLNSLWRCRLWVRGGRFP